MNAISRTWPARDQQGRTHQKVRRDSRERNAREPVEFLSSRQRAARLAAFKRHATMTRPKGRRRGHEGGYSLYCADVLDFLMFFANKTGQVFPSYRKIAESVGCAYRTAVRCIQQLAAGKWLQWQRRFIRVGEAGAREPQVHQDTNYYTLLLPTAAGQLIAAWGANRPPIPDDLDPIWAAAYADPEAAGDLRTAMRDAEEAAGRRDQHLLAKLAAARTPQAVASALMGRNALASSLAALELGVERRSAALAEREFPNGSEAAAKKIP